MKSAVKHFISTKLWLVLLALIATSCQRESYPNVVLILVDDMGYGDAQTYAGSSKIPTPNIDNLANNGIKFTDAHSSSSVCTPTRYSILTGRYAWRTHLKQGVLGPYSSTLIEPDRLTVPKMLKEKGYETALIGKWHLGMDWETTDGSSLPKHWDRNFDSSKIDHSKPIKGGPIEAGFDYFFGVDVPNFPPYIFIENDRVLGNPNVEKPADMYGTHGMMKEDWKLEEILPTLGNKAVSFINNYPFKESNKPFYLQVTTTSPHTPIVPSDEFVGKSDAGPYGDLVHQTDFVLGQIYNALEKNDLLENTIIIFTSDNGSPARAGDLHKHGTDFHKIASVTEKYKHIPNAPWRGIKADIFEGGHRVPFIVSWKNHIPENSISNELISSMDIMASLAKIVNYRLPEDAAPDSIDLTPLFTEKNTTQNEQFGRSYLVHHSVNGSFAIRHQYWKLTPQKGSGGWSNAPEGRYKSEFPGQLYNLKEDPEELNNLWEKHPEIVSELTKKLRAIQTTE